MEMFFFFFLTPGHSKIKTEASTEALSFSTGKLLNWKRLNWDHSINDQKGIHTCGSLFTWDKMQRLEAFVNIAAEAELSAQLFFFFIFLENHHSAENEPNE